MTLTKELVDKLKTEDLTTQIKTIQELILSDINISESKDLYLEFKDILLDLREANANVVFDNLFSIDTTNQERDEKINKLRLDYILKKRGLPESPDITIITHDWLVSKGFHHHSSMRLESYTKGNMTYVTENKDNIALRIQNVIYQKPVTLKKSFINLHQIMSGEEISL
jgi:hypothetical protein